MLSTIRPMTGFNPRARGGATWHWWRSAARERVSIHAPAEGATAIRFNLGEQVLFQSTRPRGATGVCRDKPPAVGVSIHTPSEMARPEPLRGSMKTTLFQSTRPRRARRVVMPWITLEEVFQSTRPQGARRGIRPRDASALRFQSTRPQGARPQIDRIPEPDVLFQSTRPQGARQLDDFFSTRWASFNPRARRGRDGGYMQGSVVIIVSIHAPAGARPPPPAPVSIPERFQSTRPQGARQEITGTRPTWSEFQSTRPQGARLKAARAVARIAKFQSTRPQGARPHLPDPHAGEDGVSIHAPAGGATLFHANQFWPYLFQSTRPQGARRLSRTSIKPLKMFQSTRPQGARRLSRTSIKPLKMFQSTRPQGARPRH